MHTVDIEGRAQPGAVYLQFTDGQNAAFTYLTTGTSAGSFNIRNEPHLRRVFQRPFVQPYKTIITSLSPGQANFCEMRKENCIRKNTAL